MNIKDMICLTVDHLKSFYVQYLHIANLYNLYNRLRASK